MLSKAKSLNTWKRTQKGKVGLKNIFVPSSISLFRVNQGPLSIRVQPDNSLAIRGSFFAGALLRHETPPERFVREHGAVTSAGSGSETTSTGRMIINDVGKTL